MCNFRDPNLVTFYLCIYFTFHLQYKHCGTFANRKCEKLSYPKNQKMCDPILLTLSKMRPQCSHSSRENATPSSGTSPLASYKEVPHPPPPARNNGASLYTAFRTSSTVSIKQLLCLKMDVKCLNFKQLTKQYPYQSKQFYKGLFIFWWR